MKTVIKRDGRKVEFDKGKIYNAILSAFAIDEPNAEEAKTIANNISTYVDNLELECMTVEQIQDIVEQQLMATDRKDVAKAYIIYRYTRGVLRNTTDKTVMELMGGTNKYWNTENSNKNATLATVQRDYLAGITSTDITNRYLLPPEIVKAHKEGILHFHDADYFIQKITNCSLINLNDMLQNGTVINKVKIDKPHRLITATTIATQIITSVASSQYGGCTITLSHLAPFVRDSYNYHLNRHLKRGIGLAIAELYAKEDLQKEIEDAVQTFNYQINSMATTNGQAPFVSVFMYLNENPEYISETSMLIDEFLNQRIKGMKNEVGVYVTQAFPKLLYVLDENNIHDDSEYFWLTEKAAYCTSKRMNPDYISAKIMKRDKNAIFPCMSCRSFLANVGVVPNIANALDYDETKPKFYGRFNEGVVTLNLVDLALSSGKDINKFWELFEERTELCHKALRCRHERLCGTLSDVAPIVWQHGAFARLKSGETIDKLLNKDYASISLGYAGLYECVKYMTGVSHTDKEFGKPLALEIMQFLRDKCEQWKESEGLGYSLYGTPIESTTYKFAQKLQNRFGIIEGITDKDYITNSYHVNVREHINPYDKLTFEGEFMTISNGGSCSYIEADDVSNNISAMISIIRHMYEFMQYGEINTKSDYCQNCGYDGEIKIIDENGSLDWECPNCGNRDKAKLNVSRRTCGLTI